MRLDLAGFPVIATLNKSRSQYFEKSHASTDPLKHRIGSWFAHKAISCISLPCNLAAISLGTAGAALTACTLGAAKVLTFAVTLGHIKPEFSIGFLWLTERTFSSLVEVVFTLGELIYDAGDLCYQGYRGVKWVLEALRLNFLAHYLKEACIFIGKRLEEGVLITANDEAAIQPVHLQEVIPFLSKLNQATLSRSPYAADQPLKMWVEHKALSLLNIPAHAVVALSSGALSIASTVAFVAKSLLFAIARIHIPHPTGFAYTAPLCMEAATNTIRNTVDVMADVAVLVYKIADATHLTQALVKVGDVILYIPRAILT